MKTFDQATFDPNGIQQLLRDKANSYVSTGTITTINVDCPLDSSFFEVTVKITVPHAASQETPEQAYERAMGIIK